MSETRRVTVPLGSPLTHYYWPTTATSPPSSHRALPAGWANRSNRKDFWKVHEGTQRSPSLNVCHFPGSGQRPSAALISDVWALFGPIIACRVVERSRGVAWCEEVGEDSVVDHVELIGVPFDGWEGPATRQPPPKP